ncbi:MAG: AAA family ATPase [Desulfomonilaceae bacterium]
MTVRLDDLIPALSDPSIYPHHPPSVQVVQTHISIVFIAGDLVYKIKKPVDLGFLDFTTFEKRRYFCQQEISLNSRFSEGIYLGVASIHYGPSGINLKGEGVEVESAVLMRRIPHDRLLINMLQNNEVTTDLLMRLADRLVYFHLHAAKGPQIASFGSSRVIYQNLKENFEQTRPYIGRTIDAQTHERISIRATEFLENHQNLFQKRITDGFIRDCHGDLHLEHVVILDEIMLYDCIEFNDRLRYGDTAADLAFLLMDLDFQGYPAFADQIGLRYADTSHDGEILRLLGFYKSYRAFVRGKVEAFILDDPEMSSAEKETARQVAKDYFQLSLAYLKPPPPPVLVITAGLMGTGKSWLASHLGKRLGIEPLRSDVLRKEIHGLSPLEHRSEQYGAGIYSERATEQTYECLLKKAAQALERGQSAIVDASFGRLHYRERAHELATRTGAWFRIVECIAPHSVVRERLQERIHKADEPSDGRWEVFEIQKADFEPLRANERPLARQWDSAADQNIFLGTFIRELLCSSQ